jgi:hypothetical protein
LSFCAADGSRARASRSLQVFFPALPSSSDARTTTERARLAARGPTEREEGREEVEGEKEEEGARWRNARALALAKVVMRSLL